MKSNLIIANSDDRIQMEIWQDGQETLERRINQSIRRVGWFPKFVRQRSIDDFIHRIKFSDLPGTSPLEKVVIVRRGSQMDRIQSSLCGGSTVIAIIDPNDAKSGKRTRIVVRHGKNDSLEIVDL